MEATAPKGSDGLGLMLIQIIATLSPTITATYFSFSFRPAISAAISSIKLLSIDRIAETWRGEAKRTECLTRYR